MLHPSELRCILLSYAVPFWATLLPYWATLDPKAYNLPPTHRSFAVPSGELILNRENPAKIPFLEQIRESAVQLSYCHIYHIMSPEPFPAPAHQSFAVPSGK